MLHNVFSLPVYQTTVGSHSGIKEVVLAEIGKLMEKPECQFEHDNSRVYSDYRLGNDPITRGYRDLLLPELRPCVEEFGDSLGIKEVEIGQMWFQHYERFSFHNTHNHWPSLFSVVYYLQFDPEQHQATTFVHPGALENKIYSAHNINWPSEFKPEVKEGDIIFFPGYLEHYVPMSRSDKPRTIISFNFNAEG
jgi:uncharacterized protein (TIGR02466 family)